MKKAIPKIFVVLLIILSVVLTYYAITYGVWHVLSQMSPGYYGHLEEKMNKYPLEVLIKKINRFDLLSPYPSIAINILGKRKEKKVTPILIKILNSNREDLKKDIFLALSNINDPRAIEPLMGIVRQGENHRYYLDALMTLATMKYEGALEYVLERAKRADAYENGSIGMLKDFGKPEYIPLLIEIKNKIPDDYYFAKFDRGRIDDAITHLKSLQQSQSPQEITK